MVGLSRSSKITGLILVVIVIGGVARRKWRRICGSRAIVCFGALEKVGFVGIISGGGIWRKIVILSRNICYSLTLSIPTVARTRGGGVVDISTVKRWLICISSRLFY